MRTNVSLPSWSVFTLSVVLCLRLPAAADDPPRSVDPRLKIELFAEHPQIRTPAGIDVDHRGRVWAIESNTHFRPEGYDGHASDRVLVLTDTDADRRADEVVTFADGLVHTMSVAVRPVWLDSSFPGSAWERTVPEALPRERPAGDPSAAPADSRRGASEDSVPRQSLGTRERQSLGTRERQSLGTRELTQVFLATRAALYLYEDTDGDLKADRRRRLVHLQTKGDYPHNGLAGFAFDALGWMYFGFGENLGEPYKIIGSDGATLSGGGEGGNIYRSKPDGSEIKLWATGFWNPHASCVDAFGRLFTVDNDPDSRPPCRLLHVIEGGDYGYRFRNGRKGTHPFTSWNGEIPGTLPMVAGTGEAPSGIVAYESDGLPEDYLGNLIVTSWGDHRIDRFRLKPKGASFESIAEPIIQGGENFRPVGLALAPDGSLYCTDWVLRDYKLHGQGRVWRISSVVAERFVVDGGELPRASIEKLEALLSSARLSVRRTAARRLAETAEGRLRLIQQNQTQEPPVRGRLEALWALVDKAFGSPELARKMVEQSDPQARPLAGTKWDEVTTAAIEIFDRLPGERILDVGVLAYNLAVHIEDREPPTGPGLTAGQAGDNSFGPISGFAYPLHRPALDARYGDPFVFRVMSGLIAKGNDEKQFTLWWKCAESMDDRAQALVVLGARRRNPSMRFLLPEALRTGGPQTRRLAVQWVAEENLKDLRPKVEAVLHSEPMTTDLLLATLAALDMLDGVPPAEFEKQPPAKYLLPIVRDESRPASLRAVALRLLPPDTQGLDVDLLGGLLDSDAAALQLEAVRTLQTDASEAAQELLRQVADDESRDGDLRAEAVLGLAASGQNLSQETVHVLARLFQGTDPALQVEAMRSLRAETATAEGLRVILHKQITAEDAPEQLRREEVRRQFDLIVERPARHELAADRVDERYLGGDPAAGRRVFFHPMSAGCSRCHTVEGRGGHVGPDLSTTGRLGRAKLIESILEPSREVAPQFTTWALVTKSGKVHTGLIVHENEGQTTIGDPEGRVVTIPTLDILERVPHRISVMPEKLHERMTVGEFRDLLAYLESLGRD